MKFRTRLIVTFVSIIVVPLVLAILAFLFFGIIMVRNSGTNYGIKVDNYVMLSDSIASFGKLTDDLFLQLEQQVEEDVSILLDEAYLDEINTQAETKASYIIVRKDNDLYYAGNDIAADMIWKRLPKFGHQIRDNGAGYYFHDLQKLVKQIDFQFPDSSHGSVFLITKVSSVISKRLLLDMFTALLLVLLITGILLTRWIQRGVFIPIREMNLAMKHIADGDLDYVLEGEDNGEIGELYHSYEGMRLKLKESTEELKQNEKQNRELVSNISHDLKTPITSIKGYVEGIMDGVADTPEKMDKYIKIIYTKANDMDRLINELTFYSGIDSNRIPYNFHCINVSEYFTDCVDDVGMDLESRNIQLNYTNFLDPSTRVIADPEQMKKVINNIISNSVKYMDKEKGIIDIRLIDISDSIRVEIEDNGKGIAARDLGNIFERFYRTDASRSSAQGGSGIGLSIVKKIIEDHGGYIWATSKEGEGTCISFVLRKYVEAEEYHE